MSEKCQADYIAAVDLERERFWISPREEFRQKGGKSGGGHRVWWYVPGCEYGNTQKREERLEEYSMDAAIPKVFNEG